THRRTAQLGGERLVLDPGEVLEQAAQCQVRGADPGPQPGRVQAVGLEPEGGAQALQRTDEMLGLGAGQGWLPPAVVVCHGGHHKGGYGRSTSGTPTWGVT